MDMRKIAYAALVAAASLTVVVATTEAPAPAPASDAIAALPMVGSIVGASILSFFALHMH
ncbi:hypothetical protein CDL12_08557 [Handroanthus impetiginosus]|uniref:Arabinogalactan peptide 23-like n=1 Tax=Handroanthus impetiginosus TaxID=429701 RepID=A0A2G9HMM8_9LAMI|nr:hypothetical protein CDL12_08557 [Handroanthus impetiginosus]